MLLSIVGFLVTLGPLVVFHEFGHYFFARLFGVKAEVFSIGFGPRLWHKQMGETELRVSAIPLGGYVKLLGEDRDAKLSPEEAKRSLHKQKAWKRFFIFFGGPLFNFIFAIFIFMAILLIGEPQIANVIGRVVHGSAAEKAGFRSGDEVLSVDGKPMRKFEEFMNAISEHPGEKVSITLVHKGLGEKKPVTFSVTPTQESGFSVYGEQKAMGLLDGIQPYPRSGTMGISDPASPAGKAGLKTGDQIVSLNGAALESWEELEQRMASIAPGEDVRLGIKKAKGQDVSVTLKRPAAGEGFEEKWGLYSSEMFIDKTVEKSPAQAAGLRSGDRLVGVGDERTQSFFELKDAVQKSGETTGKVVMHWERDGQKMTASITPTATVSRDPLLKKTTQYTVGVSPMLVLAEPVTVVDRYWNPFTLLYKATEKMVLFSWRNFVSVGKMFTGDVSLATLGGPILIAKIAGESLAHGLISFLTTMAILSIGLGVLNVLPVPVLDGGHLLLLGIEAIRGKPLTLRQMEVAQQVGLSLLLLLMVIVFKNDLTRLPFFE